MHLCTSAISFAGSVESPDRFPPQMLSRSTMPAVNNDICQGIVTVSRRG